MRKEVVLNGKGGCFEWKGRLFWMEKEVVLSWKGGCLPDKLRHPDLRQTHKGGCFG